MLQPLLAVTLSLTPGTGAPAPPGAPAALYRGLLEARADDAAAFAVSDATLERGPIRLVLASGTVSPVVAAGRPIGALFHGSGRLQVEPPPGVERDQLAKFTGAPVLDRPFRRLLLLFSDATLDELLRAREAAPARLGRGASQDWLVDRLALHLRRRGANLPARLLRDLVDGHGGLFLAEPELDDGRVVTVTLDPLADEQVEVAHWTDRYQGFFDVWCRFPYGAPAGPGARVEHYDLTLRVRGGERIEEVARLRMRPDRDGVRALQFDLHPLVELVAVALGDGRPAFWARERRDARLWESQATVVLPGPLDAGTELRFELAGEVLEAVGGGQYGMRATEGWYPRLGYGNRATYALTFDTEARHRVFASADRVDDRVEGDRRISSWRLDFPSNLVGFALGDMPVEEHREEGIPPVVVFGFEEGIVLGNHLRHIAVELGRGLRLFEEWFGPYPFGELYAASIPYRHGQGFPGLLHLPALSFGGVSTGRGAAIRGHELAHQWWGQIVGWESYRDQWLSEGFAEYTGAVFAAEVTRDPRLLSRILQAWRQDILGRGNVGRSLGVSRFGFPRKLMKYSQGSDAGPIWLGRRLCSSRSPLDYHLLVYEKGAWTLHMLRMLMHDFRTGSDDAFHAMLRDFAASYGGRNASTDGFREVVERHVGRDMSWFFDQWVKGTWLPTYRWAWKSLRLDGEDVLLLRVRQEVDGGAPFQMPVPVDIRLEGGGRQVVRVLVDKPEFTFRIPVPAPARGVEFNHGDAVLCEAHKERF